MVCRYEEILVFALLVFAPMGGWVGKIWRGGGSCTQTEKRACCINSTWFYCVARHNHAFHCDSRFTVYCTSQITITHSTTDASFVIASVGMLWRGQLRVFPHAQFGKRLYWRSRRE